MIGWLKRLFSRSAVLPPQMEGGVTLAWRRDDLPLNVYIDDGLVTDGRPAATSAMADLMFAAHDLDASLGARPLLMPVRPEAETLAMLTDPHGAPLHRSVLVRCWPLPNVGARPLKCSTLYSYDRRTGELFNCVIDWWWSASLDPAARLDNRATIMHELVHALGFGHGDGLMAPVRVSGAGPDHLNADQLDAVKAHLAGGGA